MSANVKPTAADLPPVVTREDCHAWLAEEDLQTEVWVAWRGAVRLMMEEDFGDPEEGCVLQPGTVLAQDDGRPVVDRSFFFGILLDLLYWRLRRYAEVQGLSMVGFEEASLPPGDRRGSVRDLLAAHPWGKYVDGEVKTFHFDNQREQRAFMKMLGTSSKKKTPAGAANTPGTMTNFDRSKADGTDCRT